MSDESRLVPEEVKTIAFYGDEITAALIRFEEQEARIYIPLRAICTFLGLDWSAQRQRTMRDEVFAEEVRFVVITPTNPQGGDPEVMCLPLDLLPGWLYGISVSRVKNTDLREKLTLYRRRCARVLWDAFKYEILPVAERAIQPIQPASTGAAGAYELAMAVANLAREQMTFESRLNEAARWARGMEDRVRALEIRSEPNQAISETQAAEIQIAVKTVAQALEHRGVTNGYQRVYGELYRRYGIGTYRALQQGQYDDAHTWLRSWHSELEAGGEKAT